MLSHAIQHGGHTLHWFEKAMYSSAMPGRPWPSAGLLVPVTHTHPTPHMCMHAQHMVCCPWVDQIQEQSLPGPHAWQCRYLCVCAHACNREHIRAHI